MQSLSMNPSDKKLFTFNIYFIYWYFNLFEGINEYIVTLNTKIQKKTSQRKPTLNIESQIFSFNEIQTLLHLH